MIQLRSSVEGIERLALELSPPGSIFNDEVERLRYFEVTGMKQEACSASEIRSDHIKSDDIGRYRHWGRAAAILLAIFFVAVSLGSAAPANWVQMNNDGFFGYAPTDTSTELFVFGSELYARDDHGLYNMKLDPCLKWLQLSVPVQPGSWSFHPLGSVLYLSGGSNQLWMIGEGEAFTGSNWKTVVPSGPASGSAVIPMALFKGQIYAAFYPPAKSTFEIWRSPDLAKTTMTWTKAASDRFGDSQNDELGFIAVYNGRLVAATTMTRTSLFGDPGGFGTGIEVWESGTGDPGSWVQVNEDGFGTETATVGPTGSSAPFRTNQDVGGWAVYKGYLYVGTKSHYGAEVWRYDGTGLKGWTSVTPPWAGVSELMSSPGRIMAMAVFDGHLYLAEGFSTGNLAKYDGSTWTTVVSGPNPFDPSNGGIGSLAVLDGKIYAATIHAPYSGGSVRGDQVWGYSYASKPPICITPRLPDLLYDSPLFRWLVPDHVIELTYVVKNLGPAPVEGDYALGFLLDGELVHEEPGPRLGPGEAAELFFSRDVEEGEHEMTLVVDLENGVEEADEENNEHSFGFVVGERGEGRPEPAEPEPEPRHEIEPEEERREGGFWLEAKTVPLCMRGVTHELHLRWSAGEFPLENLRLELARPGRRAPEVIEIREPVGERTIEINQPDGGIIEATLRAETPHGDVLATATTFLPPC